MDKDSTIADKPSRPLLDTATFRALIEEGQRLKEAYKNDPKVKAMRVLTAEDRAFTCR